MGTDLATHYTDELEEKYRTAYINEGVGGGTLGTDELVQLLRSKVTIRPTIA